MTVRVSDHALLRYLDRVHGIDMEFFRQAAANECEEAARAGASAAKIGDHWFILRNGELVTVLPPGSRPKSKDRRQWRALNEEIERERDFEEAAE